MLQWAVEPGPRGQAPDAFHLRDETQASDLLGACTSGFLGHELHTHIEPGATVLAVACMAFVLCDPSALEGDEAPDRFGLGPNVVVLGGVLVGLYQATAVGAGLGVGLDHFRSPGQGRWES